MRVETTDVSSYQALLEEVARNKTETKSGVLLKHHQVARVPTMHEREKIARAARLTTPIIWRFLLQLVSWSD